MADDKELLAMLTFARKAIEHGGAVRATELMQSAVRAAGACDTQDLHAGMDRLVELGYLHRVTPIGSVMGQHEVFVAGAKLVES